MDKIEKAMEYIPLTNKMPFAPAIHSPFQLEEKIAALRDFVAKENVKLNNQKPLVGKIR